MSKISIIFSFSLQPSVFSLETFSLQPSTLKPYKKSGTSLNVPFFLSIVFELSLSGFGKERQVFGCHFEEKYSQ
jgi:hypothetical protein